MLISKAYAQAVETASSMVEAPTPFEMFVKQMGMVLVLVFLFYLLLIRPQQKRFKQHSEMLSGLKKGDKVVTGGGLIGTVDKVTEGGDEVVVDLGNGNKVTALRSTIQQKSDVRVKETKADKKDDKKDKKKAK